MPFAWQLPAPARKSAQLDELAAGPEIEIIRQMIDLQAARRLGHQPGPTCLPAFAIEIAQFDICTDAQLVVAPWIVVLGRDRNQDLIGLSGKIGTTVAGNEHCLSGLRRNLRKIAETIGKICDKHLCLIAADDGVGSQFVLPFHALPAVGKLCRNNGVVVHSPHLRAYRRYCEDGDDCSDGEEERIADVFANPACGDLGQEKALCWSSIL